MLYFVVIGKGMENQNAGENLPFGITLLALKGLQENLLIQNDYICFYIYF